MPTRPLKPTLASLGGIDSHALLDLLADSLAARLAAQVAALDRQLPRALYSLREVEHLDAGLERALSQALVEGTFAALQQGGLRAELELHALRDFHRSRRRFAVVSLPALPLHLDPFRLVPSEALRWLERRALHLAGSFSTDLLERVRTTLQGSLSGALAPRQVEQQIQNTLSVSESRARMIGTTETTAAYNAGRLALFDQSEVDWVRFSAILDSRTSDLCRDRNGLVLRLDDPRLPENTPPLHPHCRSILSPVVADLEPELLQRPSLQDWSDVTPVPSDWDTGVFRMPKGVLA